MDRRGAGARGALVVAMLGVSVAACGLALSGLENADSGAGLDATALDAPTDVSLAHDGQASEASPGDGGEGGPAADADRDAPDGESGSGSPPDATPDACGALEICNDGIDDDCDGLVDCADPECQDGGWTCTPALPTGWALIAYDPVARPSCPVGWGSSTPLVEGPDAGGTSCICSCGPPLTNACDDGTARMSLGQNVCGCGQVQDVALVSDGGCNPIGAVLGQPCGPWADGMVKPIGLGSSPAPVACSDAPQRPTITFAAQGETCSAQVVAGAGCASGGGCLPAPAPAAACVEAAGLQPCPPGFTQQHVVYAPSNVVDQRQCGGCGCSATPAGCSGASVTLYDDPACTVNPVALTADGNCDSLHGDPSDAGWFRYSATLAATCSGAATTGLDGGLLLRAPATICCP